MPCGTCCDLPSAERVARPPTTPTKDVTSAATDPHRPAIATSSTAMRGMSTFPTVWNWTQENFQIHNSARGIASRETTYELYSAATDGNRYAMKRMYPMQTNERKG